MQFHNRTRYNCNPSHSYSRFYTILELKVGIIDTQNSIWLKLQRSLRLDGDPLFSEIFRGGLITLLARVGNAIFQLGINLLVARSFGSPVVGLLAMINSIMTIASIFTLFGTNTSVLRLLPEVTETVSVDASREVQRRIHRLVLFISPIVSLITILAAFIWQFTNGSAVNHIEIFLIAAAILPLYSLGRISTETLRAQHHIRLYAIAHILPALSNLLFLILFMLIFPREEGAIVALIASTFIVFLATRWMAFLPHHHPSNEVVENGSTPGYAEIFRLSLPMGITLGMQMLIDSQDLLIIGLFRSEAEAGIYAIASKLSVLASFIITSINTVSASKFSQLYYSDQKPDLLRLAKKSSSMIFWATLPILLIMVFFGKQLLGIFGTEFMVGYPVLIILVCGEFINAVGGSVGMYLNMTGSHKSYRNIIVISAITNAVINIILIPRIGILGAGIASLVSFCITNISASYLIYRKTGACISYIPQWFRNQTNI